MWQPADHGGVLVLSLIQAVPQGPEPWAALSTLLASRPEGAFVIDLTQIHQMGSEELAAVIAAIRQVHEAGGKVAFCCVQPALAGVFQSVRLTKLAELHPDREGAVRALSQRR